ncbi:MAG: class II myosin [Pycnora praestabilis]|nr:MAG: class II myosin [Pycnora praestabilis]
MSSPSHNPVGLTPSTFPTYRAIYHFEAQGQHELTLRAGDIILVVEKVDTGWWLAERPGSSSRGWVPANYLEEQITESTSSPPNLPTTFDDSAPTNGVSADEAPR